MAKLKSRHRTPDPTHRHQNATTSSYTPPLKRELSNTFQDELLQEEMTSDNKKEHIRRISCSIFLVLVISSVLMFFMVSFIETVVKTTEFDICQLDGYQFSIVQEWENFCDSVSFHTLQRCFGAENQNRTTWGGEEVYISSTLKIRSRMRRHNGSIYTLLEFGTFYLAFLEFGTFGKWWNYLRNNKAYQEEQLQEKVDALEKKYKDVCIQISLNGYVEKEDVLITRTVYECGLLEMFSNHEDLHLLNEMFAHHDTNHDQNHLKSCDGNCNPFIKISLEIAKTYIQDYGEKGISHNQAMKRVRSRIITQIYYKLNEVLGNNMKTLRCDVDDLTSYVFGITYEDQWSGGNRKLRILVIQRDSLQKIADNHLNVDTGNVTSTQVEDGVDNDFIDMSFHYRHIKERTRHLVKMNEFFPQGVKYAPFQGRPWEMYGAFKV